MTTVTNANNVVAHPTPRALYIRNANNGNAALRTYRDIMTAPDAEAPYSGPYASSMNKLALAYSSKDASMTHPWKKMGTIQCTWLCAVQATAKRLGGRSKLPMRAPTRRFSDGRGGGSTASSPSFPGAGSCCCCQRMSRGW